MQPNVPVSTSPPVSGERETARCSLCGADDFDVLVVGKDRRHGVPGEFRLVECRRCALVYLNPRPTAEALRAYYPPDYSPYRAQRGLFGYMTRRLRRREAFQLRRSLPAAAEVLEVGCAAGDLLVPLREAGFRVTGVELSDQAATIARTEHHLDVHTATLADAPVANKSFDAVIMRNVIEHLPDPKTDLERAASMLRPGGLLFIRTDNVGSLDAHIFGAFWYGFDFPRHLTLFSSETLTALVRSARLEVVQIQYSLVPTHWIMSLRYWMSERPLMGTLSHLISPRNPLLLAAGFAVAVVQKLWHNSGRFVVIARKPVG